MTEDKSNQHHRARCIRLRSFQASGCSSLSQKHTIHENSFIRIYNFPCSQQTAWSMSQPLIFRRIYLILKGMPSTTLPISLWSTTRSNVSHIRIVIAEVRPKSMCDICSIQVSSASAYGEVYVYHSSGKDQHVWMWMYLLEPLFKPD